MPYRQAARVLAEFLPVKPTETHATVRKRTIRIGVAWQLTVRMQSFRSGLAFNLRIWKFGFSN